MPRQAQILVCLKHGPKTIDLVCVSHLDVTGLGHHGTGGWGKLRCRGENSAGLVGACGRSGAPPLMTKLGP